MESLARFEVIFPPGTEDEEPATEATDCQSFSLEMLYVYVTEKISLQNFQIIGGFDPKGHGYELHIRQPNVHYSCFQWNAKVVVTAIVLTI